MKSSQVKLSDLCEGDIVIFRGGDKCAHLALVAGPWKAGEYLKIKRLSGDGAFRAGGRGIPSDAIEGAIKVDLVVE